MPSPGRLPQAWFGLALLAFAVMAQVLPRAGLPLALRLAGGGLVGAGAALIALAALRLRWEGTTLRPEGEPARLVTAGVYRLSRNPIYLGNAIILLGLSVAFDQPGGVALAAGFMWLVTRMFILGEEARLAEAFGEDFARYAAATRRWI